MADSSGQGAGIGASEVPLVAAAPSATSVAGEQAASRSVVHAWNVLRIVAMLDIATFHLSQRYLFAGVGLPVFLLLSMSLPAMAPRSGDRRTFWRRRVARLTGPWAFWTLALAALNVVRAVRHGEPPLGWAEPKMLLQGVETHFWYLPFVTLAGGVLHELDRLARDIRPASLATGCLVAALLATHLDSSFAYSDPFSQWAFAAPSIPLGLGLGSLLRAKQRTAALAFVAAFGVAAIQLHAGGFAAGDGATRFALAAILLVVLWLLPQRPSPLVTKTEPLMLGIFLLHPTVGYVLVDHWVPHGTIPPVPYALGVVLLTGAGVWAMRRTRLRAVL